MQIQEAAVTDPPKRRLDIDYLRALSILYIVGFWHALDYLPAAPDHKIALAAQLTVSMLALFVLVSGYLMGRKTIPLTRQSLREFGRKRFGRIYPPFLTATALFALLHIDSRLALLKGAMLIAMFNGPPPLTLWFVNMICLFYLVTPFLLVLRERPWIFGLACLAVTAGLIAMTILFPRVDARLALYFPAFVAGLWLAGQQRIPGWLNWAAAAALLAGLVFGRETSSDLFPVSLVALPLALGSAVLWYRLAEASQDRLPPLRAILLVSEGSFFMYLFHRPLYAAMSQLMNGTSFGLELVLLCATLVALVAVSVIAQRGYDRLLAAANRRYDSGTAQHR